MRAVLYALVGCSVLYINNRPMMFHAAHCEFYRTKPYQGSDCTCMLHYWDKLGRLWAFLRGGMTGNNLGWR